MDFHVSPSGTPFSKLVHITEMINVPNMNTSMYECALDEGSEVDRIDLIHCCRESKVKY